VEPADIGGMHPPTVNGQPIGSNSSEKNGRADFVIQKMCISITKMRNGFSASFPNRGKLFPVVLPVRAHTTSVSWSPRSNAQDT